MNTKLLFLSHAAVDRDLAEYIENTVKEGNPAINVFRASRVGQIRPGREWFDEVTTQLREADYYLILLSENSVKKPWVLFETGAAWFANQIIVPILSPNISPRQVPEPIRFLQLLSLGDSIEATEIFQEIGGKLKDPEVFTENTQKLAKIGKIKAIQEMGWKGIEYKDRYYAYDGPVEKLPEMDPTPMPKDLPQIFRSKGYEPRFSTPENFIDTFSDGFKRVWLIENWQKRRPVLSKSQQLFVRPPDFK